MGGGQVADQIIEEAGLSGHQVLLADGAVERLVLASGGVARDFLTIFRKAIDVARERGRTYRGERINAEDVNVAAGEHDRAKRDELRRDTLEEREQLESALLGIQRFCIDNKVNCRHRPHRRSLPLGCLRACTSICGRPL